MHHSEKPDGIDALGELMRSESLEGGFGETKSFPDGKITDSDEGEIKFGVTAYGSQILLNFGKPVAWLAMRADQADVLGDVLKKKAAETRKYVVGQIK